jgi:four helix bundle protein
VTDDSDAKPDIRERGFAYALRAVKLYQALEKDRNGAGRVIGRQFLRSGTSIGANVEEAQSAASRADFIYKMTISQKEARESLYWLRLLEKAEIVPLHRLQPLLQETEDIIAIITSIIVSTKRNQ